MPFPLAPRASRAQQQQQQQVQQAGWTAERAEAREEGLTHGALIKAFRKEGHSPTYSLVVMADLVVEREKNREAETEMKARGRKERPGCTSENPKADLFRRCGNS